MLEQEHPEDFGFEQAHIGTTLFLKLSFENRGKCRKYRSRVSFEHAHNYYYCLTYDKACHSAFSSVLVWTVENAAKTVVWTRIDRCVFDDTENGYF